jgi:hypothetical protein
MCADRITGAHIGNARPAAVFLIARPNRHDRAG